MLLCALCPLNRGGSLGTSVHPAVWPLRPLSRTVLSLPSLHGLCSGCPIWVHAADGEEPVPWLAFPSVQVACEPQGRPGMSLGLSD